VLLWQLHCDLLQNVPGVSLKCAVESAISVNDNKAELLIVLQQYLQGLRVEAVVAEVH